MDLVKYYSLLVLVLMAIVCQTYARTQALDDLVQEESERVKRNHAPGITGPVHTFVKTDKHAHFKWGVRHHVGHKYAGRR